MPGEDVRGKELRYMKHEEMQLMSKDALDLFAQCWEPAGEIKAVICLVHGLGEHSSRYIHWAEMLTGAGYALLALDLRGHGKSGGQRGHTPSYDHYADDVSVLFDEAARRFPGKPCFIYGHSMGGLVVAYYLIQRQPQLAGAIITGPGLRTAIEKQKAKVILARILGTILPKGSMPSGLEQEAISRDSAVVEAYKNDPLVHDQVTFAWGKQSLQASQYIFSNADRINLPLLVMHGTDDYIAFATGSEELAGLVQGDCTLKLWEGLYHEIHNEPEKDEVFAFIKDWLDNNLK